MSAEDRDREVVKGVHGIEYQIVAHDRSAGRTPEQSGTLVYFSHWAHIFEDRMSTKLILSFTASVKK